VFLEGVIRALAHPYCGLSGVHLDRTAVQAELEGVPVVFDLGEPVHHPTHIDFLYKCTT
jgi:hypothetical protein